MRCLKRELAAAALLCTLVIVEYQLHGKPQLQAAALPPATLQRPAAPERTAPTVAIRPTTTAVDLAPPPAGSRWVETLPDDSAALRCANTAKPAEQKQQPRERRKAVLVEDDAEREKEVVKQLGLLRDAAAVLDTLNVQWWLDSGTLLGAYRHADFIPMDHDVDIVVQAEDHYTILGAKDKFSAVGVIVEELYLCNEHVMVNRLICELMEQQLGFDGTSEGSSRWCVFLGVEDGGGAAAGGGGAAAAGGGGGAADAEAATGPAAAADDPPLTAGRSVSGAARVSAPS